MISKEESDKAMGDAMALIAAATFGDDVSAKTRMILSDHDPQRTDVLVACLIAYAQMLVFRLAETTGESPSEILGSIALNVMEDGDEKDN